MEEEEEAPLLAAAGVDREAAMAWLLGVMRSTPEALEAYTRHMVTQVFHAYDLAGPCACVLSVS